MEGSVLEEDADEEGEMRMAEAAFLEQVEKEDGVGDRWCRYTGIAWRWRR